MLRFHIPHRILMIFLVVMLCLLSSLSYADEIKRDMAAAVEAVRPALIRIIVVSAEYEQGREVKIESAGSGVIISPKGYAITNHHVAGNAEQLVCTLADKRTVDAKLIGTDPLADIAVIKLISPDGKPFPTAEFGDSSKLEVGDRIFAMGCPYAISQSVTMGIISNTEMIMPVGFGSDRFMLEGEDVGSIVRWIGHDALIRPGNSGGPLVDRKGKIVGINEISVGLAGAIPSNLAKEVANQLIKNGKVSRSWLGLEVQPLLKSSKAGHGILVCGVLTNSPAAKAGFQSGDILQSLAGKQMTAKFKEQIPVFNQFIADLPIGKPQTAKILRNGKEIVLKITPQERPKASDKQHEIKGWGICASNITYLMQKEMRLNSQDGVLVTGSLPSGPAGGAKLPMREGDIITQVNGQEIKDIATLRAITKKLTDSIEDSVPVLVNFDRKQKHYVTVVKIGKNENSNGGIEIRKAWLPVDMQVITRELAEALKVSDTTGVRVTQVHAGSTADKAGIKVGDLIVKLDGENIPADNIGDEEVLPSLIRQYDIGAEVKLRIIRDGKPIDVNVKLETSPRPTNDYPTYEDTNFEFISRDIAFSDRSDGDIKADQTGVYVESVSEGSWAALADLRSGDVITAVDSSQIHELDDLKKALSDITKKKPKRVVMKVCRGIHTIFIEIQPDWSESVQ